MSTIPTTTGFPLADWDGGVSISDLTQGLLLCSAYQSNQTTSPHIYAYVDVTLDTVSGLAVGSALNDAAAAWTSTVVSITGSVARVTLGAGSATPAVGDIATGPYEVEASTGVLALAASGGTHWGTLGLPFPGNSTLETRLTLINIPAPTDVLSIGFVNQPSRSCLLRFSTEGISVVSDPTGEATPLAGSAAWLSEGDITIRLITDADAGVSYLYLTPTSQVSTYGHLLAYTFSPPAPTSGLVDSFQFYLTGTAAFELKTLRAADSAKIPDQQPVAVVGDDRAAPLGEHAFLDGRDSYDPEGNELSYAWELTQAPDGSTVTLQDGEAAETSLVWPLGQVVSLVSTQVGVAVNGKRLLLTPGAAFNIVRDSLGVVVTYVAAGLLKTTLQNLLDAWTDSTDPAYDAQADAEYSLSVSGTHLGFVYLADLGAVSAVFTGGSDGSGSTNYFDPDILGVYRVGLTVSDGRLQSTQTVQIFNVMAAGVELGYVPDGEVVWKYVADWWSLVKDKEPFAHIYSSMVQQATGLLNEAWQQERAYSLATIPRRFQKRWLPYDMTYKEDLEHVCGRQALVPTSVAARIAVTWHPSDEVASTKTLFYSTLVNTATAAMFATDPLQDLVSGDSITLQTAEEGPELYTVASLQSVKASGSAYVSLSTDGVTGLLTDTSKDFGRKGVQAGDYVQVFGPLDTVNVFRVAGVGSTTARRDRTLRLYKYAGVGPVGTEIQYCVGGHLTVVEDGLVKFRVIASGSSNGYRDETLWDHWELRSGGAYDSDIASGDLLRVYGRDGKSLGTWEISNTGGDLFLQTTTADLPSAYGLSWQVERRATPESSGTWSPYGYLFAHPVFEAAEDLDDVIHVGDLAELAVVYDGVSYDTQAPVVAVRDERFSVAVALLEANGPLSTNTFVRTGVYATPAAPSGSFPSPSSFTYAVTENTRTSPILDGVELTAVRSCAQLAAPENTEGIPRLQRGPGKETDPLLYAEDYYLDDDTIVWTHPEEGTLSLPYHTGDGYPLGYAVLADEYDLSVGDTLMLTPSSDTPLAVPLTTTVTEIISTYLVRLDIAGDDAVTTPSEQYEYDFHVVNPKLLPYPETLWAEVTYLDNSEQIENNFGLAVGLPAEAVQEDGGLNLDYLSSVQALWLVAWNGPTVQNLELGTKVFFNLPFAQESGVIETINPEYTSDTGRILIRSSVEESSIKTYFYPVTIGLGTNPDTDEVWAVGDSVPIFSALTSGVDVLDYVDDPDWIIGRLEGPNELRKFHTFGLRVNLEGLQTDIGQAFELASAFIEKTKPEHTDVLIIGAYNLQDEVAVSDTVSFKGTLRLDDDSYTTADLGSWLPTSGTESMKSGFVHRLDSFDGEGNQPLELFYDHSNKERHVLWVETDNDAAIPAGELVYDTSTGAAFRVRYSGEGYLVVNYVPSTYKVELSNMTGWSGGTTLFETTGNHWQGMVTYATGTYAYIVLDHQPQTETDQQRAPLEGDAVSIGGVALGAVTLVPFQTLPVGNDVETSGGDSRGIVAVHEFPDLISDYDRHYRVGPEVFAEARAKFQVGGEPQQHLNVRGTVVPTDILYEDVTHPTWFARILASFEV